MNDIEEKTCPICAEKMDLTDQHLKPCKCGYQICVWCWHHIIEFAEKNKTEGRCPACRTPYDKEKIVGMTVSCERLVSELNIGRKKSQKVKPKNSEGRKELTGVRVIQRNLVYIMGLPFDLADEDLFQRREYFGQYGKVLKVAMSRTATGAVLQFPNNTCSVYITYSKEEEAIRCIQSVHGFVLDDRPLKACFGTMKYCHAWLRNMSCTNLECLYLHELGSQEDSFTKDETISDHMRRIVQQITSATDNLQHRSGSVLPPPVDDYVDNETSTRKIPKFVSHNAHSVVKSSPPNGSNSRSVTLPVGALWGMPNTSYSREPFRDKAVTVSSAVATNSTQMSASNSDVIKKLALEDNRTAVGNALKPPSLLDGYTDFPELSLFNKTQMSNSRTLVSASVDNSRDVPSDCLDIPEPTSQSYISMLSNGNEMINRRIQSLCTDVVSVDADSVVDGHCGITRSDSSHLDHASIKSSHTKLSQDSLQVCVNEAREFQPLQKSSRTNANEVSVLREEVNASTALMSPLVTDQYLEAEDEISLFNKQRLNDPEVLSYQPNVANNGGLLRMSTFMQPCSSHYKAAHDETRTIFGSSSLNSRGSNIAPISHGYTEMPLDLNDYLTSPHNYAKLLKLSEEEARSLKLASSSQVIDNQPRYNVFNQISHGSDFNQNFSVVPRCPVSAPPGYSVLNQPPPPGFSSDGRVQQTFDGISGNHHLSDTTMFGNRYPSLQIKNTGDVQFMAVGHQGFENPGLDFRSYFQENTNEVNLQQQVEMQNRPLSLHQNCRFTDSLGIASSRLINQTQESNILPRNLALPPWDGLSNEIQSQSRLHNERLVPDYNNIYQNQFGLNHHWSGQGAAVKSPQP